MLGTPGFLHFYSVPTAAMGRGLLLPDPLQRSHDAVGTGIERIAASAGGAPADEEFHRLTECQ